MKLIDIFPIGLFFIQLLLIKDFRRSANFRESDSHFWGRDLVSSFELIMLTWKSTQSGFLLHGMHVDKWVVLASTQLETPLTWCEFYRLDASLSSRKIKPNSFIKLNQVCKNRALCNLIFADFCWKNSACIKLVDKNPSQSSLLTTCRRLSCYHQTETVYQPAADLLQLARLYLWFFRCASMLFL